MNPVTNLLEGRPLKHPLHPILVHLPIAFFLVSFLLDIGSYVWGGNDFVRGSWYTMLVALIGAGVASIPGFVDWWDIRKDNPAYKTGLYHMVLNLVAVALYVANIFLRCVNHHDAAETPIMPFIMSIIGVILLSISGYLGGVMVYDDGIGVGRHRRHTDTPADTIKPDVAGAIDGWVSVAAANNLKEKETLRVEVASTVMTIAHNDGHLFAFQEFCTHRFGPLSEGCFKDGRIECPWHGSRFDMRTGQVTQGPAKEPLRVFEVDEREGQIWVKVPSDDKVTR